MEFLKIHKKTQLNFVVTHRYTFMQITDAWRNELSFQFLASYTI